MAQIRDIATIVLQGDIPTFKRDAPKRRRAAQVERKDVHPDVWKFAMRRVGNNPRRIVPISHTEVQILPEED